MESDVIEIPCNRWYSPSTGNLWTRYIPPRIMKPSPNGYIGIYFNGKTRRAHRVIWELINGALADGITIDHINGITTDNRLVNLRAVSHKENMRNQRLHSNNRTGLPGVYWNEAEQFFTANIGVNGKSIHLGCSKSKYILYAAYLAAKVKYHGPLSIVKLPPLSVAPE